MSTRTLLGVSRNRKIVHGNFRLLGGLDYLKPNEVTLNRTEVAGYRLRLAWQDLEPTQGGYNFQSLWDTINLAKDHNKVVGVGVAAGIVCPESWLSPLGVVFNNVTIHGNTQRMPWPFDTQFLVQWGIFIQAFAAEFESEPGLAYINMAGFGNNYGCDVVETAPDIAAFNLAGGTSAWLTAVKVTAANWAAAFRTTPIIQQMNPVVPGQSTPTTDFGDWLVANHPNHAGFMFEGWKATTGRTGFVDFIADNSATNAGGLQQIGSAASGQFGDLASGIDNLNNLGPPWYTEDYYQDFTDTNKPIWESADSILRTQYE